MNQCVGRVIRRMQDCEDLVSIQEDWVLDGNMLLPHLLNQAATLTQITCLVSALTPKLS